MIQWQFYPKSLDAPKLVKGVVTAFQEIQVEIDSETHTEQESNVVLKAVTKHLQELGFRVETGKKSGEIIEVPVLFGRNGKLEKSFRADAYHAEGKVIVEIEAGRAVSNNQFLKDLFQACMMYNVDYLILAVRNLYRGKDDFEKVVTFFDTLYASDRIKLPLKGVAVLGY
jgi:hypothetical protein